MPDICPTPAKSRYATREAAITAALRQRLTIDQPLYPYQCDATCGWWHLTSSEPVLATSEDIAVVQALDANDFRRLVIHDAQKRAPLALALALRHRSLVPRWILEIKAVQRDLQQQMDRRAKFQGDANRQWRTDTAELQSALGARRKEAAAIAARPTPAAPTDGPTQAHLRAAAGEVAIQRLTEAHREEFTRYLVEEFARVGADVPPRIRRYQEEHGIPDPEPGPANAEGEASG